MSVVERYVLARRVADRFAAAVGVPHALFEQFNERLIEFSQSEDAVLALRETLEEVFTLTQKATEALHLELTGPDVPASTYEDFAAKLKATRAQVPGSGPGNPAHLTQKVLSSFDRLAPSARMFCLAVVQQLVLPPKIRKAIEAAAKFWDKSRRNYKPKAPYSKQEERTAEYVDRYIEDLELYRKYARVFEMALEQGKAHSSEGEAATSVAVGPFTLVNTGGFDAKMMAVKAKLIEECTERMKRIGLGKVCYGNVLLTNNLGAQAHYQAFYLVGSDELFIRVDAKVTMDGVHAVCHELAHRLHYKFMGGDSNRDVKGIYEKLKSHSDDQNVDMPRRGAQVLYEGKTLSVKDIDFKRRTLKLQAEGGECVVCKQPALNHNPEDGHKPVIQRIQYTMGVQMFNKLNGKPPIATRPLDFVTGYGQKGGPSENFAEMVAFYAMGKLPPEQVELLKPLL